MITHPSATRLRDEQTNTASRYLGDIFVMARRCDQQCIDLREQIEHLLGKGTEPPKDPTYDLRREERERIAVLNAAIAPAALRCAEHLASAMPGYVPFIPQLDEDGDESLDAFMRPIFQEAGIEDDYARGGV